ncbi:MAG: dienelactone hydrolase family protein [Marmoricola sp.]
MPTIQIAGADGFAEAYLAGDSGPGVLFFIDAFGLRPQIETMLERIAGWGYVVMAPNLFYRSGDAASLAPQVDLRESGAREEFFATVKPRLEVLTSDRARADIAAYLAALRAIEGVSDAPMGVTGYCLGARLATYAAGDHPDDVAAVGAFHGGRLVTDAGDSPHLSLATARAEFVYGHADGDPSMPPEAIELLDEALRENGLTAVNEVYPGARHGYTMADTSTYDEVSAERHYGELRRLLERALSPR